MRFRLLVILALLVSAVAQPATAQTTGGGSAPAVTTQPRTIMTWVPPYAIAISKARLNQLYGGYGPRNSLTHLALQFWTPVLAPNGTLVRSTQGVTNNANIKWFVDWGHLYNIKVLLCVFNGENGWNWPQARQAFLTNRAKFIAALVAEMQARNLDGIDIDFEGEDADTVDRGYFVAFITALATQVHLKGKIVTVDSFPYVWHAPNLTWWAKLLPLVDGMTSMGYETTGRNAPGWQRYSYQLAKAVPYTTGGAKLQIGLPSNLAVWPTWPADLPASQRNTTLQQLQWFQGTVAGRVGIGIWDAQFSDASWRTAAVWSVLNYLRTH